MSLVFFLSVASHAQLDGGVPHPHRGCGMKDLTSDEMADIERKETAMKSAMKSNGFERKANGAVIKVYFHILQQANGVGAVSDQQLATQIDVLNAAFAAGGWSFVNAGKNVVVDDALFKVSRTNDASMKSGLRIGEGADLNFYTADVNWDGNLLGYVSAV